MTESFQTKEKLLWENVMAESGDSFFMDMSMLKEELTTDEIMGPTKLLGYAKESEEDIYHLPLIKNFDGQIFIKNTNATTPIFK